jgi:hypothetical protein
LRQNQDTAIGSRQKPGTVEELKARRGITREQAESCGEVQARCGKLMAIGGVLRLRSSSSGTKTRVDESA